MNFLLEKRRAWRSKERYYQDAHQKPQKTFNKVLKNLIKSKCPESGVHVGGKHGRKFTPQFLNFFRKNLL